MNEIQYIINLICQRRQVTLQKVESVAFNKKISFGLPNATNLLAATANVFYYVPSLTFHHNNYAGVAFFVCTTNDGPSSGSFGFFYKSSNNPENVFCWELDSLVYNVNTHSAGDIFIFGQVFKVTYE